MGVAVEAGIADDLQGLARGPERHAQIIERRLAGGQVGLLAVAELAIGGGGVRVGQRPEADYAGLAAVAVGPASRGSGSHDALLLEKFLHAAPPAPAVMR